MQLKNIIRIILLYVLCNFWFATTFAQLNYDYTAGKFVIKGKVVDLQTKKPIPLANILITNSGKGLSCDNEGAFKMYVSKNDTLRFSSTGYMTKVIHVYDMDSTQYYILQIELLRDFIKLKEIIIFPFRDLDEFKKAFIDSKDPHPILLPATLHHQHAPTIPEAKFYNPISFLYDKLKSRHAANPDFKP